MEQRAEIDGRRNISVQVAGDGNEVMIACDGDRLTLARYHAREPLIEKNIDLLLPENAVVPLTGRARSWNTRSKTS